jgi:hypothetical protein
MLCPNRRHLTDRIKLPMSPNALDRGRNLMGDAEPDLDPNMEQD